MRAPSARLLPCLAALLLFPACQTSEAERNREEVRRIAAAYERYTLALKEAQREFAAENPMPRTMDFGEHGTLLLRQCELTGRPGAEVLRLKYTFYNETGVRIERARVTLTLVDEEAGLEHSQTHELELPIRLDLTHGSTYTNYFDMPLDDVHTTDGWSWRVELESEKAPLPGMRGVSE